MNRKIIAFLVGLLILLLPILGISSAQEDGLYVDAGQDLGTISPLSYGSNYGPWTTVPVALMDEAEVSGTTMLRFPAGSWGDRNNVTHFQVDDLIRVCERIGAVPSISVRFQNGTPEAAAELVRYANVEMGYNVRYWSIGNEPNLYTDTVQFNRDWRIIAEAMLAVDPSITLLGPEISQYPPDFASTPKDDQGRDWMTEFLKANGDLVDIITIHRYPFPRIIGEPATIPELRANPVEWDTIIPNLRALILEITGRDMPIGVTEVSSHWGYAAFGEATPDSFYNAIWWADVQGRLIRQQVDVVNYWTLQTLTQFGPHGILASYEVRPTYYTFLMYRQFGSELVFSSSSDPEVSIYAAFNADGALTLMVVNLADDEKTVPLTLDNFTPAGEAEVWRFDAEHNAEMIGTESLGDAITLPGQSVTLYIVS